MLKPYQRLARICRFKAYMERSWSLYNKVERLRVDDLRPEQVRTIMLGIPSSQVHNWYACQEGDLHWVALQSLPEFHVDYMGAAAIPEMDEPPLAKASGDNFSEPLLTPSVPKTKPRRPLFEDSPEPLLTNPALEVVKTEINERRSARRYHKKLAFSVLIEGQSFASQTVDVSMGGMSIRDPLPAWVTKHFRAQLMLNQQTVIVFCKRVSASQIRIMDCDSWEVLRHWIVQR